MVLVGYRGVDGSVLLDCPRSLSVALERLPASGLAWTQAAATRSDAELPPRELRPGRVHAAPAGGRHRTRAAQGPGYSPVDLVSESAGTRTAMIYAAPPGQRSPLGDARREPSEATSCGTRRRTTGRFAAVRRSAFRRPTPVASRRRPRRPDRARSRRHPEGAEDRSRSSRATSAWPRWWSAGLGGRVAPLSAPMTLGLLDEPRQTATPAGSGSSRSSRS